MLMSVIAGLCGLIVGTVCTHIAEAAMARRPIAHPRCPYCMTPYHPSQWVAFIAILTGHHRCSHCTKPFRYARLLGELYVGVSWALLVYYYHSPRLWLALLATLPLAMVVVTDLEAKLIPNIIILPATALMLMLCTLFGPALRCNFLTAAS